MYSYVQICTDYRYVHICTHMGWSVFFGKRFHAHQNPKGPKYPNAECLWVFVLGIAKMVWGIWFMFGYLIFGEAANAKLAAHIRNLSEHDHSQSCHMGCP